MKRRIVAFTLAISVLAASSAFAAADLGFKNAGVTAGFVSPENLDGTFNISGYVNHGELAPRWNLESHLGYWGWSESFGGVETSIRDIVLGARTKYSFEVANPKFQPFVGGGLGFHFINVEVSDPSFGSVDAGETKLGLDLGGGFHMPVSPRADFVAESWYGIVSDVSQFSLRAGMQWKLGGN